MNLSVFTAAPAVIQLHIAVALVAVLLGAVQFARPKGTSAHRTLGRVWVAAMAILAFSGFFIHEIRVWGAWSPIHLLSAATLVLLALGVWLARNGKIERHKRMMAGIYIFALLVTGAFTFLPGRLMHQIAFG